MCLAIKWTILLCHFQDYYLRICLFILQTIYKYTNMHLQNKLGKYVFKIWIPDIPYQNSVVMLFFHSTKHTHCSYVIINPVKLFYPAAIRHVTLRHSLSLCVVRYLPNQYKRLCCLYFIFMVVTLPCGILICMSILLICWLEKFHPRHNLILKSTK